MPTEQITFRVPTPLIARAAALAKRLEARDSASTPASVYRNALQRGLDLLEAENVMRLPTAALRDAIVAHVRRGNYPETAALAAGVDRFTWKEWTESSAEPCRALMRELAAAEKAAEEEAVEGIRRAARTEPEAAAWLKARNVPLKAPKRGKR